MDAANTTVPGRVYIYLAPVGTAAPVDVTTPLTVAWINVGYTTPDSLKFATAPNFDEINTAQSDYPIRRMQTTDAASLECDLLEWSAPNFVATYGGGTVVELTPTGNFKFTPPALGARDEKAAIAEVIDGIHRFRYVLPRTIQIEGVSSDLHKGGQSVLPLRLAVLGGDAVAAWYLLTNSPSFAPAP